MVELNMPFCRRRTQYGKFRATTPWRSLTLSAGQHPTASRELDLGVAILGRALYVSQPDRVYHKLITFDAWILGPPYIAGEFAVSLSSAELVGYLRAEFAKSSRLRVTLFFLQLAVAVPAAISVVIPDNYHTTLYAVAICGALLLGLWWLVNGSYARSRSAAQAARRAALLTGGLEEALSPTEMSTLRERFTVAAQKAKQFEKSDYYASSLPAGAGRLAEMLEESAHYSEHLQSMSSRVMLGILWFFLLIFFGIAFATTPFVDREVAFLVMRVFLALIVFVMSADVLGAYQEHKAAAKELRDIRQRLSFADANGYPLPDVLLAMTDYNAAVESAPESVPWLYDLYANELDQRWKDYQTDRTVARAKRATS